MEAIKQMFMQMQNLGAKVERLERKTALPSEAPSTCPYGVARLIDLPTPNKRRIPRTSTDTLSTPTNAGLNP